MDGGRNTAESDSLFKLFARILEIALAYYVTARLGLLLAIPPGYATAVWAPSGIALAALLIFGYRVWPGVVWGSFLGNISVSFDPSSTATIITSLSFGAMIALGAGLQAVAGAFLIRRFVGFPNPLDQERDVVRFLILGGPVGCLINATWSVTSLYLGGAIPWENYFFSWWTWWAGDSIGVLIFTPLVLIWTAEPRQVWRYRKIPVALPLCLTFALVVSFFIFVSKWEQESIELKFEQQASSLGRALEKNIERHLDILSSIKGLYVSSDEVTRREFGAFVTPWLLRYPEEIQAFEWAPRISEGQRGLFEEGMRKEGYPLFQIVENGSAEKKMRAGPRAEYFPVDYIEPNEGNQTALGFDLGSDPILAEALNRAADTGEQVATARLIPIQKSAPDFGFLVFQPVYKEGAPQATVAERRLALQGFGVGVFTIHNLIETSLKDLNREGISIRIYDATTPVRETLLGDPLREENEKPGGLRWSSTLHVAGRVWTLHFWRSPEYLLAHKFWAAWTVLAGGLLFTSLLGAFLLLMTGRAARVDLLVSQRTGDLTKANRVLELEIDQRRKAEEIIQHQAYHDVLTGLPNRILFLDRLTQAFTRAPWNKRWVAVLFLDLDHFKRINDTLGHAVGDQLLKRVAERLKLCVREGDTIARLGGDEFVMILLDVAQAEDVPKVAKKVIDAMSKPFLMDGHELYITTSVGISVYPDDASDPERLLKNADMAMYRAKESGRNNYQYYSPTLDAKAFEHLTMETNLRWALEKKEFFLHYQPLVKIGNGEIIGVEALVRWLHPDQGVVPPGKFISVAEETGLIVPLGEWVFHEACAQNKAWQRAGLPPIPISVNVSARQFQSNDLIDTISFTLKETGLEPQYLELELTESIMHDGERTISMLSDLSRMGVRVSIDDFGTGYSSLSYLKRFPINKLKVDQSFVRNITSDAKDVAIATSIITLAHSLNLKAIAEGVETKEQLEQLRSLGCDEIQGYLFSKPLPAAEVVKLLAAKKIERG